MKISTKRITAALAASVLALGLFAGCTNDKVTNKDNSTASTASKADDSKENSAEDADSKTDDSTEKKDIEDGKVFNVGICQLVQHPALDAATKGFREKLTELLGEDHVKFDEQNAQGDSPTCATICNQFVSSKYDLIMANATPALQSASTATADIPIVATSITDYASALDAKNWSGKTGTNVTGTSDLAPLAEQANIVKELVPDAKKVGIVYCSAEANSKYQATEITKTFTQLGYEVKEYTFTDSNDVAQVTTSACNESDVLYIPTDNVAASNAELIDSVAGPAKKAIIAGEENICKGCGVATLSISYYDLGCTTGEMAYDILVNGKNAGNMEIQYSPKFTKEYMPDRAKSLGLKIPDGYEEIKTDAE